MRTSAQVVIENGRVLDVLRRSMNIDEAELYRTLARQRGMVFADAEELLPTLKDTLFRRFSRTFMDLYRIIPVAQKNETVVFVTDNPDARTDQVERLSPNHSIECLLVTPTDFRRIWSVLDLSVKGNRFAADQAVFSPAGSDTGNKHDNALGQESGIGHVSPYLVSVYEAILLDAASEKASDIHIEQYGERVRVRLRVDGELRDLTQYQLTPRELRGVINVIKLRAELNIAERRLPQGGRSRLQLGKVAYDLRVQTQPSLYGEHAVIRLLPQTGRAMTIAELGMSPRIGLHYERLLDNPAGLVLVVGPTGSGKSTTLYAGLQTLADDGLITMRDSALDHVIEGIIPMSELPRILPQERMASEIRGGRRSRL